MKSHDSQEFIESFLSKGALISTQRETFLIGYGAQQWTKDPAEGAPAFYFPDFFLHEPEPWLTFEHTREISRDHLLACLPQVEKSPAYEWQSPYKAHFRNCFCDLKATFKQQHLEKAVPYVFEVAEGTVSPQRLNSSLRHLLESTRNLKLYLYGFWNSKEGILGATPEILFTNLDSKTIETVACAGTSHLNDERLIADPKQLHEHRLVVDGIRESLSQLATISVGEITTVQLKHLSHLLTPIKAHLQDDFHFGSIVSALHPTPALGAFPKQKGSQWLADYQQSIDRGRYGAPVGYIGEETACYVAIRNMQWDNHHVAIGAGCGVVPESTFENEWQEILLKLRSIKELLSL